MGGNNELSEIENPEEFARELLEPFEQHSALERTREVPDFTGQVRCVAEKIEKAARGEPQNISDELVDEGLTGECEAFYSTADAHGVFYLKARDVSPSEVLYGELSVNLPSLDPTIDNEQVAPKDTFLHRWRQTAQETAEENRTDYLSVTDLNSEPGVETSKEIVYRMKVPLNYDIETLGDTINAVVTTSQEIENAYKNALSSFSVDSS